MTKGFQNKTALVTGAGSGIGRSSALAFALEGANVMVSDIIRESETFSILIGRYCKMVQ